jgi:hypothetical protein
MEDTELIRLRVHRSPLPGSCEHGDEPAVSIKGGELSVPSQLALCCMI